MSPLIACCPILNVLLENEVKDRQGKYEGAYSFQGFSNERDYWVDAEGENAIWYIPDWKDWAIGSADHIGTKKRHMRTSNDLEAICPNNEGYMLSWDYRDSNSYYDNTWFATNDVFIKCSNEDDFCTSQNPCGLDQGDCDTHDECQDDLSCGSNNCPDSLGFHSEFDCCYAPTIGDEHFCTNNNPCAIDEGDCDSNNECQTNLICDTINSCPTHLGFASDVNCCSVSGCKFCQMISCP